MMLNQENGDSKRNIHIFSMIIKTAMKDFDDNSNRVDVAIIHVCTSENNPVIFHNNADFKIGMTLFALCATRWKGKVKIYTFSLMSNHFHVLAAGLEEDIKSFICAFLSLLSKAIEPDRHLNLPVPNFFTVKDLRHLKNTIVYINRNGYVANSAFTPFSYPWGAGCHYYNPILNQLFMLNSKRLTVREIRTICHCHSYDNATLFCFNGYASPLSFCAIEEGERYFTDARKYFAALTRNIEAYQEVAFETGSKVFYTDEEMFSFIYQKAKKISPDVELLDLQYDIKAGLAREMHYLYGSSNKQISRILGIDIMTVNRLFPMSAKNNQ
jgi:hypothetical protein